MNNLKGLIVGSIIILVLIISSAFFLILLFGTPANSNKLTIYRYEGFMGYGVEDDPELNASAIDNNVFYEWGQKNGYNLTIIDTNDANELLNLLISEKESPVADVVIGIDNALLALLKYRSEANNILEPYTPSGIENIPENLINQLDPNHLLTPIDFGALAFYYDESVINQTIIPDLNNLTINDLMNPDIANQLILEDATSSSPGTGFLLWSIASNKLLNSINNWKIFWQSIKQYAYIVPSWTEGFNALYAPEVNKSILLSYATSPAYDQCWFDYSGTKAFFTHENNTKNSWLQIEGIGLVKNGPNPSGGKDFIDWMISTEVQKLIPVTNWMYPANSKAQQQLPNCFVEGAINPDNLFILNDILTIEEVENNIVSWLEEWDLIITGNPFLNGLNSTVEKIIPNIDQVFVEKRQTVLIFY